MKVGVQMVFQSHGYGPEVTDVESSMRTFGAEVPPVLQADKVGD